MDISAQGAQGGVSQWTERLQNSNSCNICFSENYCSVSSIKAVFFINDFITKFNSVEPLAVSYNVGQKSGERTFFLLSCKVGHFAFPHSV